LKVGVAQLNPTVGDLSGNRVQILEFIRAAKEEGIGLLVLPELALLGYPPRDLLLRRGFLEAAEAEFRRIVAATEGIGVVLGHVAVGGKKEANRADPSATAFGRDSLLYNAVYLLAEGEVMGWQAKHRLPSFDVFEEERYFTPGERVEVLEWQGLRLGLSVCEDFWYQGGVIAAQAAAGVDLLINASASPYFRGKPPLRHRLAKGWAQLAGAPLVYANLVGGQDELVFDGGSFAVRPDGKFLLSAPRFQEGLFSFDLAAPPVPPPAGDGIAEVAEAIVLGIRDYVEKNSLPGVLIGVSGGVDSAVTAALACRALGPKRVFVAFLPGPYTSPESRDEALALAKALGIRLLEIPIDEAVDSLSQAISRHVPVEGVVAENLQARVRGLILMAISNATGHPVLCPGNKSEIAMGYNTLYGDTVGALAPIGDLLKTEVYELARYLNEAAGKEVIPRGTLVRPPSAELRPDQRDDQDLPPYEKLDPLLSALVVGNLPREELEERFGKELTAEVLARLHRSEYKRKQLPLVIKVSPKAFGMGRRWPITNRFFR